MTHWTSSKVLLRETKITGYITNVEPLRIGAGKVDKLGSPIDLPVIKVSYMGVELPCIPGSSLKGVFRAHAEALARARGLAVCSGLAKETCMDKKQVNGRALREHIEILLKQGKSSEAIEAFASTACLMCKVFGAPSYASKVDFSDAYPLDTEGNIIPYRLGERTGIAIDRRTGAVYGKALYRVQYVEPGAKFKLRISSYNLPNYALGLLASVLKLVDSGLAKIGGFKTRGFGSVKIEQLEIAHREHEASQEAKLKPLDPADVEVDLTEVATVKEGQIVAEGQMAWKAIEKLMEAWESANL